MYIISAFNLCCVSSTSKTIEVEKSVSDLCEDSALRISLINYEYLEDNHLKYLVEDEVRDKARGNFGKEVSYIF